MREVTLKHVDGRIDSAKSQTEFALRYGMTPTHMTQIRVGKEKQRRYFHHGWYDPTPIKPIMLLDDDDQEVIVTCIPEFILDNDMTATTANKLLFKKGFHLHGLRKPDTPKKVVFKRPKYKYFFQSPSGYIHETKSLYKLARKYPHLCRRSLSHIMTNEERQKPDYKGWRFVKAEQI